MDVLRVGKPRGPRCVANPFLINEGRARAGSVVTGKNPVFLSGSINIRVR